MMLYKVLGLEGQTFNGGRGKWFLPKGKRPGKWMPPINGDLIACENGYHLCRKRDLFQWIGPTIYEVECRGEIVEFYNKVVVREARLVRKLNWDDRTARLFACDCAERAMKKYGNGDERNMKAIRVARRFANGEATQQDLAAAGAAAGAAARAAARAAAWAAAWDAAWTAARAADWDAAWDAEYKWQTKRLFEYLEGKR